MLGSGSQREWLEPLDSEGNRQGDDLLVEGRMVGCHLGLFAGLNVCDPQPGFEYEWMLNPSRSGANPADGMRIHQIGGQVVKDGDPEFAAFRQMEGMDVSPLDTSTIYKELVLVRVPIERQRARLAEIQAKNQKMLRGGPEESFVGSASALEQSARYNERGPTRFARRDHQTEFKHGDDTVGVSLPNSGIVRTDYNE